LRTAEPTSRAAALGRWWDAIDALGWPALSLPEETGGTGGTIEDMVALIDGAARGALPLPVATVCAIVPALLAAAPGRSASLAASIAAGTARLCPVLDSCQGWSRSKDRPRAAIATGGRLRLDGHAAGVEIAPGVTGYLIVCPVADHAAVSEPGLIHLPADALAAPPRRYERIDGRLSADLSFAGLDLPAEMLLARGAMAGECAQSALSLGAFLTCVEIVSALGAALEQVISYLLERKQFGVALSTFQVLRHKVADIYITYEMLRAMVQHLMRGAGPATPPPYHDVALAKLYLGQAARQAAETIIQLHGGMGMTEELPVTRLNKRLLMAEFDYGGSAWHMRQLLQAA